MIVFESASATVEVLWDQALALHLVNAAFSYYFFVLLNALFFSHLRHFSLVPLLHSLHVSGEDHDSLGSPQPIDSWEILALVMGCCLWSRYLMIYLDVPRVASFRLLIGALCMVFMAGTEFFLTVGFYAWRNLSWAWGRSADVELAFLGVGVLALLGPWAVMFFEAETNRQCSHEHGGKTTIDLVPSIVIALKKEKLQGKTA